VWLITVRSAPDGDRYADIGDQQLSAKSRHSDSPSTQRCQRVGPKWPVRAPDVGFDDTRVRDLRLVAEVLWPWRRPLLRRRQVAHRDAVQVALDHVTVTATLPLHQF
jgi:hypothetical protein